MNNLTTRSIFYFEAELRGNKKSWIRLFFIVFAFMLYLTPTSATDYYVSSSSGNDSNNGTSTNTPWKTLDKVNAISFSPGDKILFKRGDSFEGTITVTSSGISGNPITYGSYGSGNKPTISGFQTITGWTDEGEGIFSKVIYPGSAPNMLIIDGVQQAIGRYPNNACLRYESFNTNLSITDDQLSSRPDWTGAEAVIYKNYFTIDRTLITSHSGGTLTYTSLGGGRPASLTMGPPKYFIQNDLRTLDQSGEWYYDKSTGKLFVFFGTDDPTTKTTKVSVINKLMISNSSDYIVVDSLSFEGSNSSSIRFNVGADNNMFINCDIQYSGGDGFTLNGNYNTVSYCNISNINGGNENIVMNGGAIFMYGTNAVVTNNTISNIGLIEGQPRAAVYTIAVSIREDNSVFRYNIINNTAYMGIYQMVSAQNVTIQYNVFNQTCRLLTDAGSIYIGHDHTGTLIDHNIVLNSFANSIYLDAYCTGVTVTNNTVINSSGDAIKLNMASGNTITGNTLWDNPVGINFENWQTTRWLHDNLLSGNIFVAKSGQFAAELTNRYTGDNVFGTATNNYYYHPADNDQTFKVNVVGDKSSKTLSGWQTLTGTDSNSTSSALSSDNTEELFYNDTPSPKTISLSKPMIDITGAKYTGTYTIPAYCSIILMPDPNPIKNSPN